MKKLLSSLGLAALMALSGCTGTEAPDQSPSVSITQDDIAAFLSRHDLSGSVADIVEQLDQTNDDREDGPFGSVRPTELVLSDDTTEITLPIENQFYLAIAPYITSAHECYNHNLASCQGELVEREFDVTIVGADGEEIFAGPATSYANGFIGFWLPRDTSATVTIGYESMSATAEVSTGDEDPTCITTMQLA